MVDLGFLLITFFIFTTTMAQPKVMGLNLPNDTDPTHPDLEPRSAVITLLLGKDNRIAWYEGDDPSHLKTAGFQAIRTIILDKKRRTDPSWFEVILKPSKDATYKNTVDILDEMTIDQVKHYVLVDITPIEYKFMQSTL
jgi:biopolymer transport protein ExbD